MTNTTAPFAILLPPDWVRMPVDSSIDANLATIVEGVVERAPEARRVALRALLQRTATTALESARSHGAVDIILSFATIESIPIPVSIATFVITPDPSAGSTREQILVSFASPGSRAVEIGGVPAIRRVKDSSATADSPAHRGVHYVLEHPLTGEWLLITAGIVMSADIDLDDVLEAIEALVDAIVSTIRFTRSGEGS